MTGRPKWVELSAWGIHPPSLPGNIPSCWKANKLPYFDCHLPRNQDYIDSSEYMSIQLQRIGAEKRGTYSILAFCPPFSNHLRQTKGKKRGHDASGRNGMTIYRLESGFVSPLFPGTVAEIGGLRKWETYSIHKRPQNRPNRRLLPCFYPHQAIPSLQSRQIIEVFFCKSACFVHLVDISASMASILQSK